MSKYTIGLDFGTLSVRGLLLNIDSGQQVCCAESAYAHGVMDHALPCGKLLEKDWALQHPMDYIDSMCTVTNQLMALSNIPPSSVVGIGLDFTSCTILPTTEDGTPLCTLPLYENQPHAYVKLWKHHSAQYCADRLNAEASACNEPFLLRYGGKISCEWVVPKVMQIVAEAPEIYTAAQRIIEAGDWVVWQLCGKECRSACNAGYKAMWHHNDGYPSSDFFALLDPRLEHFVRDKLSDNIHPIGSMAGSLTANMAEKTGLCQGIAVAVGIIDAHASVPACGISKSGQMLMIMGTSTCHMMLSDEDKPVPGVCGIVRDGILPGSYGYEAGQSCVGDHFSWFVSNCMPENYCNDARALKLSRHRYLAQKAGKLSPGQSGLVALDWWNGVRSPLMDFDLTGLILGLTLSTKPEEIYRALVEATAFGTRAIIDAFEKGGVPVNELFAAGGIASKEPVIMQIYADVTDKEIHLSGSDQSGALGSAILAIGAAGSALTGYKSVNDAAKKLGKLSDTCYTPCKENVKIYNELYKKYLTLQRYFGIEHPEIMHELKLSSKSEEEIYEH